MVELEEKVVEFYEKVEDFRPKVLHFFVKLHDFFFQLHHFLSGLRNELCRTACPPHPPLHFRLHLVRYVSPEVGRIPFSLRPETPYSRCAARTQGE